MLVKGYFMPKKQNQKIGGANANGVEYGILKNLLKNLNLYHVINATNRF